MHIGKPDAFNFIFYVKTKHAEAKLKKEDSDVIAHLHRFQMPTTLSHCWSPILRIVQNIHNCPILKVGEREE